MARAHDEFEAALVRRSLRCEMNHVGPGNMSALFKTEG